MSRFVTVLTLTLGPGLQRNVGGWDGTRTQTETHEGWGRGVVGDPSSDPTPYESDEEPRYKTADGTDEGYQLRSPLDLRGWTLPERLTGGLGLGGMGSKFFSSPVS